VVSSREYEKDSAQGDTHLLLTTNNMEHRPRYGHQGRAASTSPRQRDDSLQTVLEPLYRVVVEMNRSCGRVAKLKECRSGDEAGHIVRERALRSAQLAGARPVHGQRTAREVKGSCGVHSVAEVKGIS
jgi:hypothetical protein